MYRLIFILLATSLHHVSYADFLVARVQTHSSDYPASQSIATKKLSLMSKYGTEPDFINPPTNHITDLDPLYEPHLVLVWDIKETGPNKFHFEDGSSILHMTLENAKYPHLKGQFVHNDRYWSDFDFKLKPRYHFILVHDGFKIRFDILSNLTTSFEQSI